MSGEVLQTSSGRRKASPKQGPLRATISISSATKEGSSLRKSNIVHCPLSGWRTRSADASFGRRSPDANSTREKPKPANAADKVRRTFSLESIYLKDVFPRDAVLCHRNRSTQTDISTSLDSIRIFRTSDTIEEKFARLTARSRHKNCAKDSDREGTDEAANNSCLICPSPNLRSPASTQPRSSRSSEEGLNQEVESYTNLVSNTNLQCDGLRDPTPEGRKAPVADFLLSSPCMCHETYPVGMKSEGSHRSSPDQEYLPQGSSPQINLSREPPDDCERVCMKPILKPVPIDPSSPQQRLLFQLKQSSHSAFECLQKGLRDAMITEMKGEQSSQTKSNDKSDE